MDTSTAPTDEDVAELRRLKREAERAEVYGPDREELAERRRQARRRPDADPAPWEQGTRDETDRAIADVRNAQARARTIAPTGRTGGGSPKRRRKGGIRP